MFSIGRKIAALAGAVALIAASVLPVFAADIGSVNATVTPQLISLTVSDGVVDYGTMALSTTRSTAESDSDALTDTQVAANNGNVSENFGIRSSDAASSGTPWDLAATAGNNAFTHAFCTTGTGVTDPCDATPTWTGFTVDNVTYTNFAVNVAPQGTKRFDLRLGTPSISSDSVTHNVIVTVLATVF